MLGFPYLASQVLLDLTPNPSSGRSRIASRLRHLAPVPNLSAWLVEGKPSIRKLMPPMRRWCMLAFAPVAWHVGVGFDVDFLLHNAPIMTGMPH
jgi:hypothetical protein